jgi:hypothetical protein
MTIKNLQYIHNYRISKSKMNYEKCVVIPWQLVGDDKGSLSVNIRPIKQLLFIPHNKRPAWMNTPDMLFACVKILTPSRDGLNVYFPEIDGEFDKWYFTHSHIDFGESWFNQVCSVDLTNVRSETLQADFESMYEGLPLTNHAMVELFDALDTYITHRHPLLLGWDALLEPVRIGHDNAIYENNTWKVDCSSESIDFFQKVAFDNRHGVFKCLNGTEILKVQELLNELRGYGIDGDDYNVETEHVMSQIDFESRD